MSTLRQIEANRRNSHKSTGPTSVTGKAVSSMNSLKSGIHAKSLLLPCENLADLQQLIEECYLHYHPANPEQRFYVDDLIRCEWTLRRLDNAETQAWRYQNEDRYTNPEKFPLGNSVSLNPNCFSKPRAPARPRPARRARPGRRTRGSPRSTPLTPNHFTPDWLRSANPQRGPTPAGALLIPAMP